MTIAVQPSFLISRRRLYASHNSVHHSAIDTASATPRLFSFTLALFCRSLGLLALFCILVSFVFNNFQPLSKKRGQYAMKSGSSRRAQCFTVWRAVLMLLAEEVVVAAA